MPFPEGAFSTFLHLGVCESASCIGDIANPPKTLGRAKGAFPRSTSKAKKHPLTKTPFSQARFKRFLEKRESVLEASDGRRPGMPRAGVVDAFLCNDAALQSKAAVLLKVSK